jgi:TctA family transporter
MAMMIGALMIQGIQPGPLVMQSNPDLFWGLIVSMWFGNAMLLIINLPLIGVWVQLLKLPYRMLFPAIVLFCCVGVYTLNNSVSDVILLAVFGIFGYVLFKFDFEPAPLLLGFILGPFIEENLRRALLLSGGDPTTFIERPVSLGFLVTAVVLLILLMLPAVYRKRKEAFVGE